MWLVALTLSLAAAPAQEKLATPGLRLTGLEAKLADPLTDHLAQSFSAFHVVTPRDISALLGLERQKSLIGCSDTSSECMAELSNALGVQGVVVGDVVKLGKAVQVNVKIIDPVNGNVLASATERLSSEDELFDALTRVAHALEPQFAQVRGITLPASTAVKAQAGPSIGLRPWHWLFIGAGVAVAAGAVMFGLSYSRLQDIREGKVPAEGIAQATQTGKTLNALSIGAFIVGGVSAAAGLGWALFGARDEPKTGTHALRWSISPGGVTVWGNF